MENSIDKLDLVQYYLDRVQKQIWTEVRIMSFRQEIIEDGQKFLKEYLDSSPEEQSKIFWLLEGIRIGKQMEKPSKEGETVVV